MANRHHKPEEIVAKLRQVEVLVGRGMDRLRKAVSDLTLAKLVLKEAAEGNW